MTKRQLNQPLIAIMILILIGGTTFFLFRISLKEEQQERDDSNLQKDEVPKRVLQKQKDTGIASNSVSTAKTPAQDSTTNPSDRDVEILNNLRLAFDYGSPVSRIRLQDTLNRYWQENPPEAEELASLIADGDAPPSFRVYIAKVFRNEVKRRRFEPDVTANAFSEVRRVITDTAEPPELRADLANVLTMVDQSDAAIRAVSPLLSEGDAVAAKAVAALCHTTNPLAVETLDGFVAESPDVVETKPRAVAAALPPLSTTEKDVVPVVRRVVDQTNDFHLYRAAVQALMHTEPTPAVIDAIAQAHAAAPRFGERGEYAEHLSRAAAGKNQRWFRKNENTVDSTTKTNIDKLLRLETNR